VSEIVVAVKIFQRPTAGNALPAEIPSATIPQTFKRRLKAYLFCLHGPFSLPTAIRLHVFSL
jgi:hypothetical protein